MVKIMRDCWNANRDKLREVLASRTDLNDCDYSLLVKLTFESIYTGEDDLDLEHITVIDDGDYQGTLLFLIPFKTYQPSEYEYIMSYIGYGSCAGCDALEAAKAWDYNDHLTDEQVKRFMSICKDLVCNTIKPYNCGWREESEWLPAEEVK